MFDQYGKLYRCWKTVDQPLRLSDPSGKKLTTGQTIVVKSDYKRFGQEGVTFVVLPYIDQREVYWRNFVNVAYQWVKYHDPSSESIY